MRLLPVLLLLLVWGCQTTGSRGTACTSDDCQDCSNGSCSSGICDRCPTALCHGRHSKYHRVWDNLNTKKHARKWARADLRDRDPKDCLSCDYRVGYEQAYVDVSMGASGEVPALPPAHYWKEWARTPEGHQRTQEWYNGYAAGAVQAKQIFEPYNRVLPSTTSGYETVGHHSSGPAAFHGGTLHYGQ